MLVGRVTADVLGESTVGMILTDGDPRSDRSNSLAGVDFQYRNTRLGAGNVVQANAWFQQSRTEGLSGSDSAFGFGGRLPRADGFRGGFAFKEIQENFNPAMGFISRVGVRDHTADFGFKRFLRGGSFLRSVFSGIDAQRVNFATGGLQSEIIVGRLIELETQTRDTLKVDFTQNEEVVVQPFTIYRDQTRSIAVPNGRYKFKDVGVALTTGSQRRLSGGITVRDGEFFSGTHTNIVLDVTWQPTRRFIFTGSYNYDDIDLREGSFITRLVQLTTQVAFSTNLSWVNLLQYDNLSEVFSLNSRLHWIPKAGREGFIVLNHNMSDIDKDNSFKSSRSDLNIKFAYTFRF